MFKTILSKTQNELKAFCFKELKKYYKHVDNRKKFIYCKGTLPVMLVAHLDTVHKTIPTQIFHDKEQNIMWSPQGIGGDDRCGIFSILTLLERGYRPHVLFTCDEEIGGIGATAFAGSKIPLKNIKYLIELDRRGHNDCVFYDCGNEDFLKYVETFGFEEEYGSFSDICSISPVYDVASVNLSIGYYNEHTSSEYINLTHMNETIDKVAKMLDDSKVAPAFDYQETVYNYPSYWNNTKANLTSTGNCKDTTDKTLWYKLYGYESEEEFWLEEYGYVPKGQ